MALAEIQRALARLYTDGPLRERFFADPEATAASLGLGVEETRLLARLPAGETHFFARSLQRKRRDQVAALLPLTHRALGNAFERLFLRYAATRVPKGPKKGREDAIAFVTFLERLPAAPQELPSWIRDIACYEAAWLRTADPACRCIVRWFRSPVGRIARDLSASAEVPQPPRRATLGFWLRFSRRRRVWHAVLPLVPG